MMECIGDGRLEGHGSSVQGQRDERSIWEVVMKPWMDEPVQKGWNMVGYMVYN